jgi:hypothetical protein
MDDQDFEINVSALNDDDKAIALNEMVHITQHLANKHDIDSLSIVAIRNKTFGSWGYAWVDGEKFNGCDNKLMSFRYEPSNLEDVAEKEFGK